MSNDPFSDQASQAGFVAGIVARLRPVESAAAASSPAVHHRRTESEELEDHMAGSEYKPTDVCPRCGYARMSSVYCSVSQTHHGTDKPLNTPRREKRGILARLQELIGADGNKSDEDDSNGSRRSRDGSSPSSQDGERDDASTSREHASTPPAAATCSPATTSTSWSIFKTKEEKQVDELRQEEERARRRIVDDCMVDMRISEMNIREYGKKVRADQKVHRQGRRDLELTCKAEFDIIYKERKDQLEVMQKIFAAELKKTKNEEKSAAKKIPPLREAPNNEVEAESSHVAAAASSGGS